jgi:hypothetical protein
LSCGLIFGAYIQGAREGEVAYRYLFVVLVIALLGIGEQRYCLPYADIGSVSCAPCIVVLLYDFPLPALCTLYAVVRIPVALLSFLRKGQSEEVQLLGLLVYFRVDPKIAHIRISAVAAVIDDVVRVVGKLELWTFLVIKGFPCLSLQYWRVFGACIP